MQTMKKDRNTRIEETVVMINIMSDDIPIYKFNMLKHSVIANIDREKRIMDKVINSQ